MSHCSYKQQLAWNFLLFRTVRTSLHLLSCKRKLSVLCVEVWRGRVQGVAGSPSMWLWCGQTSSCTLAILGSWGKVVFLATHVNRKYTLYTFFDRGFAHILGQIVSTRVKTLTITNSVALRHIKRKNASLLVDVDQEWRCAACWVTHVWKFL